MAHLSLASVDRKEKIIQLLETNGKVIVKDLALELNVSTETVRKYLDDLQEEGKLVKVYGGAIPPPSKEFEPPLLEREVLNKKAKENIGKKAVELIEDYDVIGIDDGSTPYYLAKHLKGKQNLTIVTPSINSLNVLVHSIASGLFTGKIILLGGEVDPTHQRITGELALNMLDNIYVEKYFVSADGISESGLITSHDVSKGMITKKLINHSNENILLLDNSKIGKRGHYKMTDLNKINTLITNDELDESWQSLFRKNNVKFIVADNN